MLKVGLKQELIPGGYAVISVNKEVWIMNT